MRTIKCCSVAIGVTSSLSCHYQDSLMMRGAAAFVDHERRTTHKCYNPYSTVKMLITRDGPAVIDANARYWLKIAVDFLPQLGGSRRNVRHNVWYGKTIGWRTKSGPFHFIATHTHTLIKTLFNMSTLRCINMFIYDIMNDVAKNISSSSSSSSLLLQKRTSGTTTSKWWNLNRTARWKTTLTAALE